MPTPSSKDDRKRKVAKPTIGAVALLMASLIVYEKREHVPYRDIVGVLTVCEGITGPDVVSGRYYTDAACEEMTRRYVDRMNARLVACIGPQTDRDWIWIGHFAYNVGTAGFCKSTMAAHLRRGDELAACNQIMRWTFAGGKDCKVKANRCGGIVKRREHELRMCLEART